MRSARHAKAPFAVGYKPACPLCAGTGCGHAVAVASARLMCAMPGLSHRVLDECKQLVLTFATSSSKLVPVRLATTFVLLLEQACGWYEQEADTFRLSLAAEMKQRYEAREHEQGTTKPAQQHQDRLDQEEQARQLSAATGRFANSLVVSGSVPASHLPLLLAILSTINSNQESQSTAMQAMQAASMQALARLLSISSILAEAHGTVVGNTLLHVEDGPLMLSSVIAAETLLLCNPNMSSILLPSLEAVIMTQLSRSPHSSSLSLGLHTAVHAYIRIIMAEVLQLSGASYGVLACILMSRLESLQHMASLAVQHMCSLCATTTERCQVFLRLYTNCPEDQRYVFVQTILLPRFLSQHDLQAEPLVLQVLQSVLMSRSADARKAAVVLLACCKPTSVKPLEGLLAALEGGEQFDHALLPGLRSFVRNVKIGVGKDSKSLARNRLMSRLLQLLEKPRHKRRAE
eukprot:351140-Chlamydomonas_euryale.AAC.40